MTTTLEWPVEELEEGFMVPLASRPDKFRVVESVFRTSPDNYVLVAFRDGVPEWYPTGSTIGVIAYGEAD